MPTESVQQFPAAFEIGLLLAGVLLLLKLTLDPGQRKHWLGDNRLPAWPLSAAEFTALLLLLFACGYFLQTGVRLIFGSSISRATDRAALEVFLYGTAFHGGALVGWWLFPTLRRNWYADTGVAAPPAPPANPARLPWTKVLLYGAGTVLVAFPILIVLNVGWIALLQKLGLPDEPQDLIGIFSNVKSPLVVAGLLLVACVVAPVNEELVFRAGLYRFCRPRLGRGWSLVICGGIFGAVHGNLAGFLPLAVLGAGLAMAYEATGDIRVAMTAHGLFNLINTVLVFSGIAQ